MERIVAQIVKIVKRKYAIELVDRDDLFCKFYGVFIVYFLLTDALFITFQKSGS